MMDCAAVSILYGWGERVGNITTTSKAGGKHTATVDDVHFYFYTGNGEVEGFYADEIAPGGEFHDRPWCRLDQLAGTSLADSQVGEDMGRLKAQKKGKEGEARAHHQQL